MDSLQQNSKDSHIKLLLDNIQNELSATLEISLLTVQNIFGQFYIDLMMEGVKYIRMLKTKDVNVARQLQTMLRDKYADHDQVANYSGSCEYVSHVIQLLQTVIFVSMYLPAKQNLQVTFDVLRDI